MKKTISFIFVIAIALMLVGCNGFDKDAPWIENPSFESGTTEGWTQSGNIYRQQSVVDDSAFDGVATKHAGRYHLTGRFSELGATGTLSSSSFVVGKSGYISMLLAAGKDKEKCYIAICDARSKKELVKVGNIYFVENPSKEQSLTDGYARHNIDLTEFKGKKVFLKIVDNDNGNDFGYISVDGIDVNVTQENLTVYMIDAVARQVDKVEEVVDSVYQVKNGTFDKRLEHWTTTGGAFTDDNIQSEREWIINGLSVPYNNDGLFFNGFISDAAKGSMTSQPFTVGGTGYISFKLGGGRDGALNYVSVYEKNVNGIETEVARYYNQQFLDYGNWSQSEVGNPLYINNMVTYKADLSKYMGKELFFKVVDNGTRDWGMLFLDSFITYYPSESKIPDCIVANNILPNHIKGTEYQIENGGFETGDMTGWTIISGSAFNLPSTQWRFWREGILLDKGGNYLMSGIASENATGVMTSTKFTVGGSGIISFKLGGGARADLCYISIKRASDNIEVARLGNTAFSDSNFPSPEMGMRLFNMQTYTYDLSEYSGTELYIEITDKQSTQDYYRGMVIDDIVTYYELAPKITNSVTAINKLVRGDK